MSVNGSHVDSDGTGALRARAYDRYSSTHAGLSGPGAAVLAYRSDLRPHLPRPADGIRVLDIGCGQGALVRLLRADGFDAHGIDISAEQVHLARSGGVADVELGDFHDRLNGSRWQAVVATDVLEHLHRAELVTAFGRIHDALAPGGVLIGRVPNAVCPLGGYVMYGDITHETWFTAGSVRQLAAVAGFAAVRTFSCPPRVHGLRSALRVMIWQPFAAVLKLALAAETGVLANHIVTQNLVFVATKAPVATKTPVAPKTPVTPRTP